MGLAHALALPGCVDTITDAFGPRPLLEAYQVAWLGVEPRTATDWEREQAGRLGTIAIAARTAVAVARGRYLPAPPRPLYQTCPAINR